MWKGKDHGQFNWKFPPFFLGECTITMKSRFGCCTFHFHLQWFSDVILMHNGSPWICDVKSKTFLLSIIMVCNSFHPSVRVSLHNHLSCCSQWTYGHDFWYRGGHWCKAFLSMDITYNSVSIPIQWAVAAPPHGQLASYTWSKSFYTFTVTGCDIDRHLHLKGGEMDNLRTAKGKWFKVAIC